MSKTFASSIVALLLSSLAWAETAVPSAPALAAAGLFTDSMVLQRDSAVPVWGTAPAGKTVTVSFRSQTKKFKAGTLGQ